MRGLGPVSGVGKPRCSVRRCPVPTCGYVSGFFPGLSKVEQAAKPPWVRGPPFVASCGPSAWGPTCFSAWLGPVPVPVSSAPGTGNASVWGLS